MPASMGNHVLVQVRTAAGSGNQHGVEAGEGVLIYVRININSRQSLSGSSKQPPSSVPGPTCASSGSLSMGQSLRHTFG